MTTTCPNGHKSKWPDWCSTCGERVGPVASGSDAAAPESGGQVPVGTVEATAAAPAAVGPTCENCGVSRREHDVFCESCGYDFASGSLPDTTSEATGDGDGEAAPLSPPAPMHAKIELDTGFFAASVGDVELELPDPLPTSAVVPLPGIRILIGRTSKSRGIFPEIDVRDLTNDPAVSSRHAMLERDAENNWTLTDLGSTNGTYLSPAADDAIEPGVALPVQAGTMIFLGAWTRIELDETVA